MDTHIPLCIFLCLWTVQITGVYGDQIKKIPEGYDLGLNDIPRKKQALSDYSCSVKHVKAGCFNDKTKPSLRAMSELLFQDRSDKGKSFSGQKVDWNNWNTYLPDLVCRCAVAAVNRGYTFFGIQFYGECWSSSDAASRFYIYHKNDKCVNTEYKPCDKASDKPCAGVAHANFVYEIVPDSPNGSGVGPPINPEEY